MGKGNLFLCVFGGWKRNLDSGIEIARMQWEQFVAKNEEVFDVCFQTGDKMGLSVSAFYFISSKETRFAITRGSGDTEQSFASMMGKSLVGKFMCSFSFLPRLTFSACSVAFLVNFVSIEDEKISFNLSVKRKNARAKMQCWKKTLICKRCEVT